MKNIYIVRHGESEGNARLVGESTGYVIDSKINLTTRGILQASYAGIICRHNAFKNIEEQ